MSILSNIGKGFRVHGNQATQRILTAVIPQKGLLFLNGLAILLARPVFFPIFFGYKRATIGIPVCPRTG